jgi:hypothetical protein
MLERIAVIIITLASITAVGGAGVVAYRSVKKQQHMLAGVFLVLMLVALNFVRTGIGIMIGWLR